MRFYKKIFIVFFGLLVITTWGALGADTQICDSNEYIAKCDLHWDGNPAWTAQHDAFFTGAEITPENIFYALTITSALNSGGNNIYLCWDINDPKVNYDNLRKLFNPTETDGDLSCFQLGGPATAQEKLIYAQNYIVTSIAYNPGNIILTPFNIPQTIYKTAGDLVKLLCQKDSIQDHPNYCVACPHTGRSEGAYHDGSQWTKFSTIADCSNWKEEADGHKTYDDGTGTFYYSNDGVCHYSGG